MFRIKFTAFPQQMTAERVARRLARSCFEIFAKSADAPPSWLVLVDWCWSPPALWTVETSLLWHVTHHQSTHSIQNNYVRRLNSFMPESRQSETLEWHNWDPSAGLFFRVLVGRRMHCAPNQQVNCICILDWCRMHTSSTIKPQSYCFFVKMKTAGCNRPIESHVPFLQ